ncbi:MAG: DUF1120 domain-containing protein [Pseudomonas sp.]
MKKTLTLLGSTFLLAGASCAFAASSTDLTVTGIITPVACTPSLSNGGVVDNGKILAKDLNPTKNTELGKHPLQLTVACDAPTQFALNPVDNRAGTTSNSGGFGLGLTDASEKLGFVNVVVSNALADGLPARTIESDDDCKSWLLTTKTTSGLLLSVGAAAGTPTPIAVKDMTMDFEVNTYIAPANDLTLTNEVTMDGSVTFEMKHL